jgi:hypothetical protein
MEHQAARASESLRRLFDSYSNCLALGRNYVAETREGREFDIDRLESFLRARAELLDEAGHNFEALAALEAAGPAADDGERQALRRQVAAVLEEMTGLESDLSAYLGERLREIGEALRHLRRIRPAFQRYSHLGGDKADPSLITRHE